MVPTMDKILVNFNIEMRFSFSEDEGNKLYDWYHGKVSKVANEKTYRVKIKWDGDCLVNDDAMILDHQEEQEKEHREYLTT